MNGPVTAWASIAEGARVVIAGRPAAPRTAPGPTLTPAEVARLASRTARPCPVCGLPVDPGVASQPRTKHPACVDTSRYLTALGKAVRQVKAVGITPAAAKRLSGELLALRNELPAAYYSRRGAGGRFVKGGAR